MTRGDYLSEFELYVLLAIVRRGDDAPGAEVRQEIEEASGRSPSIGAVHTTLGRLEEKGLVKYRVLDPEPVRGGRARKAYALTPAGRRAMERSASAMTRMLDGIVGPDPERAR
jgi:DNA-binding PadR family transcriptional regulator